MPPSIRRAGRSLTRHGLAGLALVLASVPSQAGAQRVVPVEHEPRHRLIYSSSAMLVLDVQIQPGDTTLLHTHATPITYVTIGTSSTDARTVDGEWGGTIARRPPPGRLGAVRSVVSYAERPLTHQVTNVGSTLFRLIAVPNLGPGTDDAARAPMLGEIVSENRWFRHATLLLTARGTSEASPTAAPTAVVLIADGRIALERADGWITSLERAGDVAVLPAGERYRLVNGRDEVARVVLVEVR